jgi:hypothetical protein
MVNFTPRLLYPQEMSRYPLKKKLDGPERGSEPFRDERNLLLLPVFEPRTVQPVA